MDYWVVGGVPAPTVSYSNYGPCRFAHFITPVLADPGVNAAGGGAPSPFQDFPLGAGYPRGPLPGPVLTGQRFSLWATRT